MNPETNHLIIMDSPLDDFHEITEEMREDYLRAGYIPVPKELNRASQRKLNGHHQALVSFHSGGKLSNWAVKQRRGNR